MAKAATQPTLTAQPRTAGLSPAKLRHQGWIPAVVYGHGIEATSLQLPSEAFDRLFKTAGESTIIGLSVEGESTSRSVLVKDVQLDPLDERHLHVDLYQIRDDEELKATIPLRFVNEAPAIKEFGGILITNKDEVDVECLPKDLPRDIEVDLSTLTEIDSAITVKDLQVADGVKILAEPDESIVVVTPPAAEEAEPIKSEAEAIAEVEATAEKPETEEGKTEGGEKS